MTQTPQKDYNSVINLVLFEFLNDKQVVYTFFVFPSV